MNEGKSSTAMPSEPRQNQWGKPKRHSMPESNSAFFLARPPPEWCYFSEHRRKDTNRAFPVAFPAGCSNTFCPPRQYRAKTARCSFHNGIPHTSRLRAVPPYCRAWQPSWHRRSTAEMKTTSLYRLLYRPRGERSITFWTENRNNPNIGNF